jgi:hypothetical protein
MVLTWSAVLALAGFCFGRVLRGPNKNPNTRRSDGRE